MGQWNGGGRWKEGSKDGWRVSGAAGEAVGGAGEGTPSRRRSLRSREALVPAAGKERLLPTRWRTGS